jgi:hypothetical protein
MAAADNAGRTIGVYLVTDRITKYSNLLTPILGDPPGL